MSFTKEPRNFRGTGAHNLRLALAHIENEGSALIQTVARREPAKVLAFKTGITRRHVYNLREGECQPGWLAFIALAQQYPELRAAVGRWLNLADPSDSKAHALLDELRRFAQSLPEEGDRR